MDRKEACEQIILLPKEKQLLKRIRRSKTNGLKCSGEEVEALESYGLVEPIREKYKGFGVPVPTDRYVVYCHRELLDYIADKWVDILASVISLISLAISIVALLQVPPA